MNLLDLEKLRDKKVHIVGLSSVEGNAVANFLIEYGFTNLVAHDFKRRDEFERSFKLVHVGMSKKDREIAFARLKHLPIKINYKDIYLEGIMQADAIFATQAWFIYDCNLPKLEEAKKSGIPFYTMTELYFDLAPCPIIAVTGTNGKSTTAKMISEIMFASPFKTYFAGNDRHSVQVLDKLEEMRSEDFLILEVSNRQLRELEKSPHIAVITNVYPNHLDEHTSFEDYIETKERLIRYQGEDDFAVLNYDNEITRGFIERCSSQVFPFSRKEILKQGAFIKDGYIMVRIGEEETEICSLSDLGVRGEHNLENALAAVMAASLVGVEAEIISSTLRKFRGLKHRLQLVLRVKGVEYYDDLNSTTPQAAIVALRCFNSPVILIAGGDDKDLDYNELGRIIVDRAKLLLLLPGKGTEKLEREVSRWKSRLEVENPIIEHCESLEEAVKLAHISAQSGDIVLLSPACPYFFRMFYLSDEGGNRGFKSLVKEIALGKKR